MGKKQEIVKFDYDEGYTIEIFTIPNVDFVLVQHEWHDEDTGVRQVDVKYYTPEQVNIMIEAFQIGQERLSLSHSLNTQEKTQ